MLGCVYKTVVHLIIIRVLSPRGWWWFLFPSLSGFFVNDHDGHRPVLFPPPLLTGIRSLLAITS